MAATTTTESPPSRTVPMEVLCLGMCRTGTQSLADALPLLGYGPVYHMREAFKNDHKPLWVPLLERKYKHKDGSISHAEFDAMLGDYGGVSDVPTCLFAPELMDAYPTASIILTTRDPTAWLTSMRQTLFHKPPGPFAAQWYEYVWGPEAERTDASLQAVLERHAEEVRSAARERGRAVLEYRVGEGWEPLCAFLEKEVPKEVFPRSDDWVEYKEEHGLVGK